MCRDTCRDMCSVEFRQAMPHSFMFSVAQCLYSMNSVVNDTLMQLLGKSIDGYVASPAAVFESSCSLKRFRCIVLNRAKSVHAFIFHASSTLCCTLRTVRSSSVSVSVSVSVSYSPLYLGAVKPN